MQVLAAELIGRAILIGLSAATVRAGWWMPVVAAPLFWMIWDMIFSRRSQGRITSIYTLISTMAACRHIANILSWFIAIAYFCYTTVSFGLWIGEWYAWVLGAVIAYVVVGYMGLLWPYRWHLESDEGRDEE